MKTKDIGEIRSILSMTEEDVESQIKTLDNIDGRRLRHEGSDMTTALLALRRAHQHLQKVRVSFEERVDGLED